MLARFCACAILNLVDAMRAAGDNDPDRICWLIVLLIFEVWPKFIGF